MKKYVIIVISLVLIVGITSISKKNYSIHEPFQYSILPGTDDSFNVFKQARSDYE